MAPGIGDLGWESDDSLFGHRKNLALGEGLYLIFSAEGTIKPKVIDGGEKIITFSFCKQNLECEKDLDWKGTCGCA